MNKQSLFCSLFLCMTVMVSAATFTVNNNNPSPGQYTTIDAAMAAAANGDVILINGSPTVYAFTNITKSLTFIGAGYAALKDNPLQTKVSFNSGAFVSASNVTLKGLVFTGDFSGNANIVNGVNVTISECFFVSSRLALNGNTANFTARNNVFSFIDASSIFFFSGGSGATFENNIFNSGAQFRNQALAAGVTIRNNVFLGGSGATNLSSNGNLNNWIFQNNIFWNVVALPLGTNSTYINNISYSPNNDVNVPIPNGGLNVGNINANPQFVNYSGGVFSTAHNYRLQAASLGHLAGTDGTDIGAYGGATPHTDHGMPNIPVMKVMNITAGAVPIGGTIQVTFQSAIQN